MRKKQQKYFLLIFTIVFGLSWANVFGGRVHVQNLTDKKIYEIELAEGATAQDLKDEIVKNDSAFANGVRLIFSRKELEDKAVLPEVCFQQQQTVIMVKVTAKKSRLFIKFPEGGETIAVDFDQNTTVGDLKTDIAEQAHIPVSQQNLVFGDESLKENLKRLNDYKVLNGSMIKLFKLDELKLLVEFVEQARSLTLSLPSSATVEVLRDQVAKDLDVDPESLVLYSGTTQLDLNKKVSLYLLLEKVSILQEKTQEVKTQGPSSSHLGPDLEGFEGKKLLRSGRAKVGLAVTVAALLAVTAIGAVVKMGGLLEVLRMVMGYRKLTPELLEQEACKLKELYEQGFLATSSERVIILQKYAPWDRKKIEQRMFEPMGEDISIV